MVLWHMRQLWFISAIVLFHGAAGHAAPGPATVQQGKYRCVFFINGSLTTTPGFTIQKDGVYVHDSGEKGRYTYAAPEGLLTFQGGSLDKQAGLVERNDKNGIVRIYNERRSRTVMDCDTPRR
jgi:hypothetical protein